MWRSAEDMAMNSVERSEIESEKYAIDLSTALAMMAEGSQFEIPVGLLPNALGPVTRAGWQRGIFFMNARSLPDPLRFTGTDADANVFGGMAKDGHLVFGVQSNDDTGRSSSNIIQSRTSDVLLFIRLLNQDQSEERELSHYLNDLTEFIKGTKQLDLSLEVVETPEYSRYRLFDENGDGVEKEMSLVGNVDRNKELNRLVAEIALRRAGPDPKVERYSASDQSFQEWQFEHPTGVVMVLGLTRPFLHVAGCPTMIEELRSEFEMVCAPNVNNLLVWADESGQRIPGLCSKCFTLPSNS
jgi:hypothetical protein